jgi:hypothetical protein
MREDLAKVSVHLPYYSEIHTYIRADVLSEDKVYMHSSPTEKRRRNQSVIANDGGDYMPHVTRVLRAQKAQVQLLRVTEKSALQTASRHELVAVVGCEGSEESPSKRRGKFNHIQVLIRESYTLYNVKEVFLGLKNMQLTPSQLNQRFLQAGLLATGVTFHQLIQRIDMATYPFCVFFLTRDNAPKDQAATELCLARIRAAHRYMQHFLNKKRGVKVAEGESFEALYRQVVSGFYVVWKSRLDMASFTVKASEQARLDDCRLGDKLRPIMQLFWRLERKLRIMTLFTVRILSLKLSYPEVAPPPTGTISSELARWNARWLSSHEPEVDALTESLATGLHVGL